MTTTDTAPIRLTKAQSSALALLAEGPCELAAGTDAERRRLSRTIGGELVDLGYAQSDGDGQPLLITHIGRAALAMSRGEPAPNPDDAGTLDLPAAPPRSTLDDELRDALALLVDHGSATRGTQTGADNGVVVITSATAMRLVDQGFARVDPENLDRIIVTPEGAFALGFDVVPAGASTPVQPDDLAAEEEERQHSRPSPDPGDALAPPAHYVVEIPLDLLHEVEHNRDKGDLTGLADSIRVRGVREPVLVRSRGELGGYEIVDGARRVEASRMAGKTTCPSLIDNDVDDVQAELDRILLNVQRLDPSPLEEATAYERLTQAPFKMAAHDIATAVGRSESHVSKRRSLLVLPDTARDALVDGRINIQTALGMTALAKDKDALKAAVAAIPSAKSTGQKLEWERQALERTINSKLEELDRVRKMETLVKQLEAAGETILPWKEWQEDEGDHGDEKWRQIDEGEEHEAVVIQPFGSLHVLKVTTQPEPTGETPPTGAHKPPKPAGDIGFVEQARRKKQQDLDEIAVPRRQIVTNLLAVDGQDDVLQGFIIDEVSAAILGDSEIGYFDTRVALELLGLAEDVARDYHRDRETLAAYAERDEAAKLRAATAALMSIGESTLVSTVETREPGCWAPLDERDYDEHEVERRYLAFLERHGYELHPTEFAAITPAPADDSTDGESDAGS